MAKVQIKSEKLSFFREILHVRVLFPRFVGPAIDKVVDCVMPGTFKEGEARCALPLQY